MKKLLAAMLALIMLLTACEAAPAEQTDGALSVQAQNEENISEKPKQEEHFEESESKAEEEKLSSSSASSGGNSDEKDNNKNKNKDRDDTLNSYVIRANSSNNAGESFLWKHSVNEQKKGECQVLLFKSKKELTSFVSSLGNYYQIEAGKNSLKELLESYDEEFFEENTLVIGHILANSGSIRYIVKDTSSKSGKYIVNMKVEAPEAGTMDMADWFAVIEEPSSRIEDCIYFALSVKSAATSSEAEWKDK